MRVRDDVISKFSHKHLFNRRTSRRRHHETTLRIDKHFAREVSPRRKMASICGVATPTSGRVRSPNQSAHPPRSLARFRCPVASTSYERRRPLLRRYAFPARDGETNVKRLADGLSLRIISAARACVSANLQISSNVACVSALIGLKLELPQSFVHISARTLLTTGALIQPFRKLPKRDEFFRFSIRRSRRARNGCPQCHQR